MRAVWRGLLAACAGGLHRWVTRVFSPLARGQGQWDASSGAGRTHVVVASCPIHTETSYRQWIEPVLTLAPETTAEERRRRIEELGACCPGEHHIFTAGDHMARLDTLAGTYCVWSQTGLAERATSVRFLEGLLGIRGVDGVTEPAAVLWLHSRPWRAGALSKSSRSSGTMNW